jgi:hypothetical protein
MAGFEVITYGRFWVTAEEENTDLRSVVKGIPTELSIPREARYTPTRTVDSHIAE